MRIYKIANNESDNILEMLSDFDESAVQQIKSEILNDIKNYYATGNLPPKYEKIYQHKDYQVNVAFMPSNNMTGVNSASQNFLSIKLLNNDKINHQYTDPQEQQNEKNYQIEKIDRELDVLNHEMGHYHITQKQPNRKLSYYTDEGVDYKKYFLDPEEIVMHSREILGILLKSYPNFLQAPLPLIKKQIETQINYLPGRINAPHPMNAKTKKIYLDFIMNKFVKPNIQK